MVIINGEIKNENKVFIDNGFQYGAGVFETILIKNKPLFLDKHCERMKNGLTKLKINNTTNIDEDYLLKNIKQYDIANCILKIIVTEKNVVLSTRQSKYTYQNYLRGAKVKLGTLRRNPSSHTVFLKSLNYMGNILEKENAASEGFDEVLFLNCHGELAEGSISNIFFIKGNKIYTPAIECGLLDGIIRRWVIDNFKVNEGRYSLTEIYQADEVFITNSIMGIMKVASIENTFYSKSCLLENIRNKYENYIL